jgi:hypothetical protein
MAGILCFENVGQSSSVMTNVAGANVDVGGAVLAGYPKTNAYDASSTTQFRFGGGTSYQADFVFTRKANGILAPGICAVSIQNIYWQNGLTSNGNRVQIEVQLSTASSFASPFYTGRRMVYDDRSANAPQQAIFIVDPLTNPDYIARGGRPLPTNTYVRVKFFNPDTLDMGFGDLCLWSGMRMNIKEGGGLTLAGRDDSTTQEARAGHPFIDRRARRRRVVVGITGLDDIDVWGGQRKNFLDAAGDQRHQASIAGINWRTGTSRPVLWTPDASIGNSYHAFGATIETSAWSAHTDLQIQSKSVYGLLDEPIEAREIAKTSSGDFVYEAEFAITEIMSDAPTS